MKINIDKIKKNMVLVGISVVGLAVGVHTVSEIEQEKNFYSQTDMTDEEIKEMEAVINCNFENIDALKEEDYIFLINRDMKACYGSVTSGEDSWLSAPVGRYRLRSDQLGSIDFEVKNVDEEYNFTVDYKTGQMKIENIHPNKEDTTGYLKLK